jgi:hypothetical protein
LQKVFDLLHLLFGFVGIAIAVGVMAAVNDIVETVS